LWSAIVFFYVFPTGRFEPGWTRLLALACAVWAGLWVLVPDIPYAPINPLDLELKWFLAHEAWFLSGIVAQVVRFGRERDAVRRQQTRWIVAALLVAVLGYAAVMLPGMFWPALQVAGGPRLVYRLVVLPLYEVSLVLVPLSIVLSILRHRLWDMDVLLNRALVYSALTALLALVYVSCVVALQLLLPGVIALASPLVTAISTLATAALFMPLRGRVQAFIDRRFFRRRYDAAQTLAGFSRQLRTSQGADLAWLVEQAETVIAETLHPAHTLTWLRTATGGYAVHVLAEMGVAANSRERGREAATIAAEDPLVGHLRAATGPVDLGATPPLGASPAARWLRAASVNLVVPLLSQDELVGWFTLGPRLSMSQYSADDRTFLAGLAGQAAPALRVAQLVRQQQAEARRLERVEHEMRLAGAIQQTLLRQVPKLPGWALAAHYQPARSVGGDFYDLVRLPDGQLGLTIGDVTDKGVPAALLMAATRSYVRAAALQGWPPGVVLRHVNELLCPDMPAKMFVTCLYAVLDPATGRLRFANAGHHVPYRRHADGTTSELRARGMPLGLMDGMAYEEQEAALAPGDCLLLYSDGLIEAHDAQRQMFGAARLRDLLATSTGQCEAVIAQLLDALQAYTDPGQEQEDDVTLLVVQRHELP
jgi:serine phosphatase RsbU (regulator of sigma subunit)